MKLHLNFARSHVLLCQYIMFKKSLYNTGAKSPLFTLLLFSGYLFLSSNQLQGQSIVRQVIGITGGSTSTSFGSVHYTLGQTAVSHVKSSDQQFSLTQGFQQPNIQVKPTHTFDNPMLDLAPNPVIDILNVKVLNPQADQTTYTLIDPLGRTLERGNFKTCSNEIDMSNYPAGSYFIQVKLEGIGDIQAYKIIKY